MAGTDGTQDPNFWPDGHELTDTSPLPDIDRPLPIAEEISEATLGKWLGDLSMATMRLEGSEENQLIIKTVTDGVIKFFQTELSRRRAASEPRADSDSETGPLPALMSGRQVYPRPRRVPISRS